MDLRTITTFNAIVEYGSFQAAAQHLNYAQSTITSHIKKLESSLGVILFDRNQNLQLTEAGILLKEKGQFLLKSYESLERSLHDLIDGQAVSIRIGVMEPMASYRLPIVIKQFIEKYPKVNISLQIHGSKLLSEMVSKGELDFAICASSRPQEGLSFQPILEEEVVLLVPKNHPLGEIDNLFLAHIQNEALIITNTYCPFRNAFEFKMLENGLIPQYSMEVSNMLTLKYYVQAGFGAAIVPLVAVSPPPDQTIIKKISNFQDGLTVGILRKEHATLHNVIEELIHTISLIEK